MAKYTATYACGHTGTVQLFGKYNDRYRTLDYLATCECPDCKEQTRQKQNKANAAVAESMGFPALVGSPKQIAWAETIRMGLYDAWMELISRNRGAKHASQVLDVIHYTMQHAIIASEWIDNRDDEGAMLRKYQSRRDAEQPKKEE